MSWPGLRQVGLHLFLNKTKFGTAMRAAALQSQSGKFHGNQRIRHPRRHLGPLGQALPEYWARRLGPYYGVYTTMGALIGQKAFAGAVAGGYGNIYGAIIGGMFFGFLETFTAAYITTVYKDCICFGVMILVLIFMPTGLFKEQVLE